MRSSHSHQHPLSRSLEKYIEKENQYPTYNFHTNKDKLRTNTSQLPLAMSKKSSEGYYSHLTLKPKPVYKTNELENINMIETYSKSFLNQNKMLPHCGFLSRHEVTCLFRAKMVDWMVEVMSSYKCTDRTLFKAIEVMDQYYMKTQKTQKAKDLHLIGVTCILIANKMQEVYPLKIKILHEKIAHKKLSIAQISQKQSQIFQTLDYNLNVQSLCDCVEILLACYCIQNQHYDKLEKISIYIAKMVAYDYNVISTYSKEVICAAVVVHSLRVLEGMMSKFQAKPLVSSIVRLVKHHKNVIYECGESVEKLVKNFDNLYPNLPNFKKFNKLVVDGKSVKSYL